MVIYKQDRREISAAYAAGHIRVIVNRGGADRRAGTIPRTFLRLRAAAALTFLQIDMIQMVGRGLRTIGIPAGTPGHHQTDLRRAGIFGTVEPDPRTLEQDRWISDGKNRRER